VPHFDGLSDTIKSIAANAPQPTAVEFLRSAIRSSREPVMLVSTGPLTNIALLFALDPEIPSLLRGFVSMAGVFGPHARDVETNCRADPFAAAVVRRLHQGLGLSAALASITRSLRQKGKTRPLNTRKDAKKRRFSKVFSFGVF